MNKQFNAESSTAFFAHNNFLVEEGSKGRDDLKRFLDSVPASFLPCIEKVQFAIQLYLCHCRNSVSDGLRSLEKGRCLNDVASLLADNRELKGLRKLRVECSQALLGRRKQGSNNMKKEDRIQAIFNALLKLRETGTATTEVVFPNTPFFIFLDWNAL